MPLTGRRHREGYREDVNQAGSCYRWGRRGHHRNECPTTLPSVFPTRETATARGGSELPNKADTTEGEQTDLRRALVKETNIFPCARRVNLYSRSVIRA